MSLPSIVVRIKLYDTRSSAQKDLLPFCDYLYSFIASISGTHIPS
jgi:hypothetical protein